MNTEMVRRLAIAGNCLFVIWVTYNGIDEGFRGSPVQVTAYVALVALLASNVWLLVKK